MALRLLLIALTAVVLRAQSVDLRGIWKAEGKAYLNLEAAGVIVDPPSGKIPYHPEALTQVAANFTNRAAADPDARCFQPGVPRGAVLPYPFQILQNDRAVYIVYERVHSYRILYLDGTPHNVGACEECDEELANCTIVDAHADDCFTLGERKEQNLTRTFISIHNDSIGCQGLTYSDELSTLAGGPVCAVMLFSESIVNIDIDFVLLPPVLSGRHIDPSGRRQRQAISTHSSLGGRARARPPPRTFASSVKGVARPLVAPVIGTFGLETLRHAVFPFGSDVTGPPLLTPGGFKAAAHLSDRVADWAEF